MIFVQYPDKRIGTFNWFVKILIEYFFTFGEP